MPRATLAHLSRGPRCTVHVSRCTVHVSHHPRAFLIIHLSTCRIIRLSTCHSQAEILKKRARGIHESMDAAFWEEVSTAQRSRTDYWEPHRSDDGGGSLVWHNYVTDEKRTERPEECSF